MRNTGWVVGVGASILLGPVVYVVARLAAFLAPQAIPAPVVLPVRELHRHR